MGVVAVVVLCDGVAVGVTDDNVRVNGEAVTSDAGVGGDVVGAGCEGVDVGRLFGRECDGERLRRCRLCCEYDVDGSHKG